MRTEQERHLIERLNESMEAMDELGLLPDRENIRSAIAKIDELIIEREKTRRLIAGGSS